MHMQKRRSTFSFLIQEHLIQNICICRDFLQKCSRTLMSSHEKLLSSLVVVMLRVPFLSVFLCFILFSLHSCCIKLFLYPFDINVINTKAVMFLTLHTTAQKHHIIFPFCSRRVFKSEKCSLGCICNFLLSTAQE